MNIQVFNNMAIVAIILWIMGSLIILADQKIKFGRILGNVLTLSGSIVLVWFVSIIWIKIERPPLRTLGETRLWYSIFLSLLGIITYNKWKYKWFLFYSLGLAALFLFFNIKSPENFDKTLMPALQSLWFVPHVIVYMLSYALLGGSCVFAFYGLYQHYYKTVNYNIITKTDNLVYMGFALLTLGMLFGALWAKVAWGHYWTWDPKETWALLTWLFYLLYIHLRYRHKQNIETSLWILAIAFIVLMICWMGINYLSVGGNSVHTYSN